MLPSSTNLAPITSIWRWLAGKGSIPSQRGAGLRPDRVGSERPKSESGSVSSFLRAETTGGVLLLGATVVALVVANTTGGFYQRVWGAHLGFGPHWLRLDAMTSSSWVTEGLLAIFFFVVGLELKREVVVGQLADAKTAALPVIAALGGMVAPALICFLFARGHGGSHVWAIPVATDIAFALGVLSLAGRRVPNSLRLILLTLAVADDLGGIFLIAVLFASGLQLGWLAATAGLLACFSYAQRRRWRSPLLYGPLAVAAWTCLHASGIHSTIAGVALGLLVRVHPDPGEQNSPVERLEHRLAPISAGFIVPIFALSTTGVSLKLSALSHVFGSPVTQGVMVGLLAGKFVGVLGAAWMAVRLGIARLPADLSWPDLVPLGLLAGIGYTVSLLIANLALPGDADGAATAILIASTAASIFALLALSARFGRLGRTRTPVLPPMPSAGLGDSGPGQSGVVRRERTSPGFRGIPAQAP